MTPPRRGGLRACEARTQGAFVAGGYGRNRGHRPRAVQHGPTGQGFVPARVRRKKPGRTREGLPATLRPSPRRSGDFSLSVMPSPDAIEQEVRQFLRDNFPLSADGVALDKEDSLIEVGVIDSTGVLELIGFIEERYELTIADEEVLPENLDSIANITRFVGDKTASANGA